MYCDKCGAENSDTARFCRKCGLEIGREEETKVALRAEKGVASNGHEADLFSISPTLVFVKAGYAAAALGAILFVALVSILLPTIVPVWVAIVLGLLFFLIPAFYHFKQKLVRYRLTGSTLEFDSGLISRTTRSIPIRRIQDVTVSATAWQRLFGFGDVVIDNASEEGGKAVMRNINSPRQYADLLLTELRRLDK
jgi:putative membrane protein